MSASGKEVSGCLKWSTYSQKRSSLTGGTVGWCFIVIAYVKSLGSMGDGPIIFVSPGTLIFLNASISMVLSGFWHVLFS